MNSQSETITRILSFFLEVAEWIRHPLLNMAKHRRSKHVKSYLASLAYVAIEQLDDDKVCTRFRELVPEGEKKAEEDSGTSKFSSDCEEDKKLILEFFTKGEPRAITHAMMGYKLVCNYMDILWRSKEFETGKEPLQRTLEQAVNEVLSKLNSGVSETIGIFSVFLAFCTVIIGDILSAQQAPTCLIYLCISILAIVIIVAIIMVKKYREAVIEVSLRPLFRAIEYLNSFSVYDFSTLKNIYDQANALIPESEQDD